VWIAATISFLGDGVVLVGFPLLAASLTSDPLAISIVQVARGLPWLLFGVFGGVVADRVDRRWAMVVADTCRACAIGLLAVSVYTSTVTIGVVWIAAFALATGEVLFDPAVQALVPVIVQPSQLQRANGRLFASESSAMEFIGPALGGALFAAAQWLPFAADAVSFAVAALFVASIRGVFLPATTVPGPETAGDSARSAIRTAWSWLRNHPLLWWLAIFGAATNFAAAGVEAVLVVFAKQNLGLGDFGFGLLLAGAAVGGTVASLTADRLLNWAGPGTVYIAAAAVGGVAMALGAAVSNGPVFGLLLALAFAAVAATNVLTYSLRGELVPDELRGRVASIFRTMLWSVWPFGALVGGWLAKNVSVTTPLVFFGIVNVATAVVACVVANNRVVANARSLDTV
jgi:MFS family permease